MCSKNGADLHPRRFGSSFSPGVFNGYFLAFFPPETGTVAMVCRMRPAIL